MLGRRGRGGCEQAALALARERLNRLDLYPEPVWVQDVRVLVMGWLFALPWFARFDGYAIWNLILLRERSLLYDNDLITHECCHVWQQQHGWVRMWCSYLVSGYERNRFEEQARRAVLLTRQDRS